MEKKALVKAKAIDFSSNSSNVDTIASEDDETPQKA